MWGDKHVLKVPVADSKTDPGSDVCDCGFRRIVLFFDPCEHRVKLCIDTYLPDLFDFCTLHKTLH